MKAKKILLASHGTEGAQAAERAALELCEAGGSIHQLLVVPDLWKDMMGDDWLNNGLTRDRYATYVENTLEAELREHIERVQGEAESANLEYSYELVVGKPEQVLAQRANRGGYDLAVIGSPRPKGKQGIRSRMKLESLTRSLRVPLMILPFPDA